MFFFTFCTCCPLGWVFICLGRFCLYVQSPVQSRDRIRSHRRSKSEQESSIKYVRRSIFNLQISLRQGNSMFIFIICSNQDKMQGLSMILFKSETQCVHLLFFSFVHKYYLRFHSFTLLRSFRLLVIINPATSQAWRQCAWRMCTGGASWRWRWAHSEAHVSRDRPIRQ